MDKKTRRMLAASGWLDIALAALGLLGGVLFVFGMNYAVQSEPEEDFAAAVGAGFLLLIMYVIAAAAALYVFLKFLISGIRFLKSSKRGRDAASARMCAERADERAFWCRCLTGVCICMAIFIFAVAGKILWLLPCIAWLSLFVADYIVKKLSLERIRYLPQSGTFSDPSGGTPPADPFA